MTRIAAATTKLSLLLGAVVATVLLLPGVVSAIDPVYDNTIRCEPHPTEEGQDVCLGSLTYYYYPWGRRRGFTWTFSFVEDANSDPYTTIFGEPFFVATDWEYISCYVGLGWNSDLAGEDQFCRSCSYCGSDDPSGPGERITNGFFKADCTNLPGGRMIDNCTSTFPYFFPVDFWDDDYVSPFATAVPEDTMAPSDADSYQASGTGTSDPPSIDSDSDSDSSDDDSKSKDESVDGRTYDDSSEGEDKKPTLPAVATYMYQSEMKIRMDVSPDNNVSTMDAEIVLEKYKKFLQQQPSLSGVIHPIDLIFESRETQTVMRLDGATVGTVIIKFETKVGVTEEASSTTPKQVATFMAQQVDWSDFIVHYLRSTQGGSALKRTSHVNLKLIGEGGDGGGRVRRLGGVSTASVFEVVGEGSI